MGKIIHSPGARTWHMIQTVTFGYKITTDYPFFSNTLTYNGKIVSIPFSINSKKETS